MKKKDTRKRNRSTYLMEYRKRDGVKLKMSEWRKRWKMSHKTIRNPMPDLITLITLDTLIEMDCTSINSRKQSLVKRFWDRVNKSKNDQCWEWIGERFKNNYGMLCVGVSPNHRKMLAHRISFLIAGNSLRSGELVLHSCDNKGCVNPNHLRAGNYSDNINDAFERNQRPMTTWTKGEQNGRAKLNVAQVAEIRMIPNSVPAREVAMPYGVTATLIRSIRKGKIWKGQT